MENPVLVTLMHCWALVPQRLFITTYRPPMVVEPNWSQIWVSAWAVPATTNAVIDPAASRMAAAVARRARFMTAPCGRDPRGDGCGSAPIARYNRSILVNSIAGRFRAGERRPAGRCDRPARHRRMRHAPEQFAFTFSARQNDSGNQEFA